MEVWSQWSPIAWPFGWLLSTLFSRRLQQLGIPLDRLMRPTARTAGSSPLRPTMGPNECRVKHRLPGSSDRERPHSEHGGCAQHRSGGSSRVAPCQQRGRWRGRI